MNFLEERIVRDGIVKAGNVLKVDSFLNHQMDIALMEQIGKEFKRRFADKHVTKVLTIEQIPAMVTNAMLELTSSKFVILLLITILLLIVGCVMDTTPAILVLAPILLPVVESFGVHPVHFGIAMVVNLAIGFLTPPLGVNLFVAARVGNEKVDTVIKGIVPFIIVMVACLLLITYFEDISMLLPNLLERKT